MQVIPEEGEVGIGEEGRVLLARLHELLKLADLGGIHGLVVALFRLLSSGSFLDLSQLGFFGSPRRRSALLCFGFDGGGRLGDEGSLLEPS